MEPWERVGMIATAQYGAVTRRQMVEAGVCGRVLTERVRQQGWDRPYRGVYVMPGTARTFEMEASAALLAVGSGAVLTGTAAAHLDGLLRRRPGVVEIALPAQRGPSGRPGLVLRRHAPGALAGARRLQRLPVAGIPLMLVDLARSHDDPAVSRVTATLCARRAATLQDLVSALASLGPVPGSARLRRVLAGLRGELTHSGAERLLRRHVRALGVTVWPRPYPVVHRDRVVAEIDLAVPGVRYGAEVDGPHHLLPEQIAADRARDRALGRLGWTIDRFGVDMVRRTPGKVAREIAARLATLGHRVPPR